MYIYISVSNHSILTLVVHITLLLGKLTRHFGDEIVTKILR